MSSSSEIQSRQGNIARGASHNSRSALHRVRLWRNVSAGRLTRWACRLRQGGREGWPGRTAHGRVMSPLTGFCRFSLFKNRLSCQLCKVSRRHGSTGAPSRVGSRLRLLASEPPDHAGAPQGSQAPPGPCLLRYSPGSLCRSGAPVRLSLASQPFMLHSLVSSWPFCRQAVLESR